MKNIKYLSILMLMILLLTGCGTTNENTKNEEKEDNRPVAVNPSLDPNYTGVKKIVYLDPTNLNKKCTENDVNSNDENKSGCMKWYAYKEEDNSYTMILDHNTSNLINWIIKEDYINAGGKEENVTTYPDGRTAPPTDKGGITANKQLEKDTSYWEKSLNIRLISASEIREINGNKREFSEYAWLYDRTSNKCEEKGCLNNATTKNSNGYWTDTASDYHNIYYVSAEGVLAKWGTVNDVWEGIRPVITVQKENLNIVEE